MNISEIKITIAELEKVEKSLSEEITSFQKSFKKYETALSINKTAIELLENSKTPPEIVVSEQVRKMLYAKIELIEIPDTYTNIDDRWKKLWIERINETFFSTLNKMVKQSSKELKKILLPYRKQHQTYEKELNTIKEKRVYYEKQLRGSLLKPIRNHKTMVKKKNRTILIPELKKDIGDLNKEIEKWYASDIKVIKTKIKDRILELYSTKIYMGKFSRPDFIREIFPHLKHKEKVKNRPNHKWTVNHLLKMFK